MQPDEILQEARRRCKEAAADWAAAKTDPERRAALRKNLEALRKVGQHLFGEDAAWLTWQAETALSDLDTGRRPSWLNPAKVPDRTKPAKPAGGRIPIGAAAACVDILMRVQSEPEALREVSKAFNIPASRLGNLRKKIGPTYGGNENAKQARADMIRIFDGYADPVRAIRWWIENGKVHLLTD
jgi:hypothetical protein